MKILDLFCCCGGMSRGFVNAGHSVVGVDITNNHQYPYELVHSDVFKLEPKFFEEFDLIHASPPCQHYIPTNKWKENDHPDLLPRTRELLTEIGKPFIIENVVGAPIRKDLRLCGEMFGLRVIRHRLFEIEGFTVLQPPHQKHKLSVMDGTAVGVFSGGINPGFWGDKQKQEEYRKIRDVDRSLKSWQDAMEIDWITNKKHLAQAIPPKYAEYIIRNY